MLQQLLPNACNPATGRRRSLPKLRSIRAAAVCIAVLTHCTQTFAANDAYAKARERMVKDQIEARDVRDPAVLAAMRAVPRHEFVPATRIGDAHRDGPLPIGHGQTISQPYIVASMTEELALEPGDRVLEVGTGSGYQAAVLAEITPHVYSIEIVEPLASAATKRLQRLGYETVQTRHGDGWFGWPQAAPFDAIVVTAAPSQIPPSLVKQLKLGGRLVIPVGPQFATQTLVVVTKQPDGRVHTRSLYAVRFVPFTRDGADTGN